MLHVWRRSVAGFRRAARIWGLSINSVARELGIGADQYRAYETGAKSAPKLLLTRIAKYFGVPAVWFSPNLVLKMVDARKAMPRLRGRYRVATLEDRVIYLINVFCKLDLERQQQLIAVAGALASGIVEATYQPNVR